MPCAVVRRPIAVEPVMPPKKDEPVGAEVSAVAQRTLRSLSSSRPLSDADVLGILYKILELLLKEEGQESVMRTAQRREQLIQMQKSVETLRDQGFWQLSVGLGAGLMGILGGVAPIVGYVKGDAILGMLSSRFSSLQGMETNKFFSSMSDVMRAGSTIYDNVGRVHDSYSNSDRTRSDTMGNIAGSECDEAVRKREEKLAVRRAVEQFVTQFLEMQHAQWRHATPA